MLQDAISKMDPTVSNCAQAHLGEQCVSPAPSSSAAHIIGRSVPPGLLQGTRDVLSLCGQHTKQPGSVPPAHLHLLSTYCVPSVQIECPCPCGLFMSTPR